MDTVCELDAFALDGFTRERRLGEGASAHVWHMTRISDGQQFAARVLHATVEGSSSFDDVVPGRMYDEPIVSQHLVQVVERSVWRCPQGHVHDVHLMEFYAGGTLSDAIAARGPLSLGETITTLTPLAQVIDAVHHHGLTHGDISPANVLFSAEGRPVLADLSETRRVGEADGGTVGTPGFWDPAARSADRLHPASDIYSLSALAWYCLTGRVPGSMSSRPPLPVLVPEVPVALAQLIEAGLADEPQQRPSAARVARGIYSAADAEPVDLTDSVPLQVRPHLLTRRDLRQRPVKRRRALVRKLGVTRAPKLSAPPLKSVRRADRQQRDPFRRRRARQLVIASLVIVALGVALGSTAAWLMPFADDAGRAAPVSDPTAPTPGTSNPVTPETTEPAPSVPAPPAEAAPPDETASIDPETAKAVRSDNPEQAARALVELRTSAFSTGQWGLLEQVNAAGSSSERSDGKASAKLRDKGHKLSGLNVDVTCAERIPWPAGGESTAIVKLCLKTSGFVEVDGDARTVRTVFEDRAQEVQMQLRRDDGQWRVELIRSAAPSTDSQ